MLSCCCPRKRADARVDPDEHDGLLDFHEESEGPEMLTEAQIAVLLQHQEGIESLELDDVEDRIAEESFQRSLQRNAPSGAVMEPVVATTSTPGQEPRGSTSATTTPVKLPAGLQSFWASSDDTDVAGAAELADRSTMTSPVQQRSSADAGTDARSDEMGGFDPDFDPRSAPSTPAPAAPVEFPALFTRDGSNTTPTQVPRSPGPEARDDAMSGGGAGADSPATVPFASSVIVDAAATPASAGTRSPAFFTPSSVPRAAATAASAAPESATGKSTAGDEGDNDVFFSPDMVGASPGVVPVRTAPRSEFDDLFSPGLSSAGRISSADEGISKLDAMSSPDLDAAHAASSAADVLTEARSSDSDGVGPAQSGSLDDHAVADDDVVDERPVDVEIDQQQTVVEPDDLGQPDAEDEQLGTEPELVQASLDDVATDEEASEQPETSVPGVEAEPQTMNNLDDEIDNGGDAVAQAEPADQQSLFDLDDDTALAAETQQSALFDLDNDAPAPATETRGSTLFELDDEDTALAAETQQSTLLDLDNDDDTPAAETQQSTLFDLDNDDTAPAAETQQSSSALFDLDNDNDGIAPAAETQGSTLFDLDNEDSAPASVEADKPGDDDLATKEGGVKNLHLDLLGGDDDDEMGSTAGEDDTATPRPGDDTSASATGAGGKKKKKRKGKKR